ncbi:hypothetical protein Tco_0610382 [Tanacetum coccineum]
MVNMVPHEAFACRCAEGDVVLRQSYKPKSYGKLYYACPKSKDSDSDVEEDQRTSNEFMADLNDKYHERALLANQKRLVIFKKTVLQTKPPHHPTHHQITPSTNPNPTLHPSTKHLPRIQGKSEKGKNEKGKSEKGLIVESFDWDEESVSSDDEGTTKIRAFMAIAEDEPSVGKADARSDYTHVDLQYVEDQRKNLLNKFNLLKQELVNLENESQKDEISNLKKVIEKWTCSKVTLDQLLSEQIHSNIVKALGGKDRARTSRREIYDDSTYDPPKLIGDSPKVDSSTEQLLLTLMEEDYLKRSVWYLDSGCSRHMTGVKQYLHRYSKEPGPKVVFGYDSLGDTEGYG